MIKLIDLLEDMQNDAVNSAAQEINQIKLEGLTKLIARPKKIANKVLLQKISISPPPSLNVVEIFELIINPEYQGKGIGTSVLKQITDIADKYNVSLYLEAVPIGNKSLTMYKLVNLYKKFGFRVIKGGNRPIMLRSN